MTLALLEPDSSGSSFDPKDSNAYDDNIIVNVTHRGHGISSRRVVDSSTPNFPDFLGHEGRVNLEAS